MVFFLLGLPFQGESVPTEEALTPVPEADTCWSSADLEGLGEQRTEFQLLILRKIGSVFPAVPSQAEQSLTTCNTNCSPLPPLERKASVSSPCSLALGSRCVCVPLESLSLIPQFLSQACPFVWPQTSPRAGGSHRTAVQEWM